MRTQRQQYIQMTMRAYHDTYHHMSKKHLRRYVNEFAGRHNVRNSDTIVQMEKLVEKMAEKRLPYAKLIS